MARMRSRNEIRRRWSGLLAIAAMAQAQPLGRELLLHQVVGIRRNRLLSVIQNMSDTARQHDEVTGNRLNGGSPGTRTVRLPSRTTKK